MYDPSTVLINSFKHFRPIKYLAHYVQENLELQAENKM
jgi:hypothetical protein